MRGRALTILLLGAVLVGSAAGVVLAIDCLDGESFGASSWHRQFAQALRQNGEVHLADLVSFEWNAVYIFGAYDLAESSARRVEILGSEKRLGWEDNQGYWTIVYRRPEAPPFVLRMDARDWHRRALSYPWSLERSAKLKLVAPGSKDAHRCPRGPRGCLFLDDSRPQLSGR